MFRYRINEIKTDIDVPMEQLPAVIARKTGISAGDIKRWEIRRKSIDSRKKPHIQYVYTIDFDTDRNLLKGGRRRISGLTLIDPEKEKVTPPVQGTDKLDGRPVVVGMGPCGLFAGLELARLGYRPLIIERGPAMEDRALAVEKFRKDRVLDPEANMLFGEGGAGTFSDGKIGTGIKDSLIRQVLAEFRDAGAGEEIMYLAKPHIGTDVLRTVIVNLRKKVEELGGEVRFNTRLDSLIIEEGRLTGIRVVRTPVTRVISREDRMVMYREDARAMNREDRMVMYREDARAMNREDGRARHTDAGTGKGTGHPDSAEELIPASALILAIGHSARDTFSMINDAGLGMEQKPFSIGVRMEHPQRMIDEAQYGTENAERFAGDARIAEEETGMLPPADYKISYKASNGRGVYSFCMCPGGEVVVCTTAEGKLCVNGMSARRRNSGTANSGILCDVRTEDFDSDDVLAGVRFQEKYERLAFINGGGNYTPPRCRMGDFLGELSYTERYDPGRDPYEGRQIVSGSEGAGSAKKVIDSLPYFASEALREAVPAFARRISGYDDPDAVITAVETRSSSPVRIIRDADGESNIRGIYPAGEGAGYAGGITSAAIDGIRAAWHIVEKYAASE